MSKRGSGSSARKSSFGNISIGGGENPQKWVEDNLKERATGIKADWEKRTKRAKKFKYKSLEEYRNSSKPNGKGRSEAEITSSTYERAQKRLQKKVDSWFKR